MAFTTYGEIFQYIQENVRVDPESLPKATTAAWFAGPDKTITTVWRIDLKSKKGCVPFDEYLRIFYIFQDEDTIRAYCLPEPPTNPRPQVWEGDNRLPSRFVLTRTAPTYVAEVMTPDVWAEEVTRELNALIPDDDEPTADEELENVVEFLSEMHKATPPGHSVKLDAVIQALQEFQHRPEESDEGDDGEPDEAPTTDAAAEAPADAARAPAVDPA